MQIFRRRQRNKGTILVNTLWILSILSLLALAMAWRISLEIKLTQHGLAQFKDLYTAKSAVIYAMEVVRRDRYPAYDAFNEDWANKREIFGNKELGEAKFTISYTYSYDADGNPIKYFGLIDEERKINLNLDDLNKLEKILSNLKMILDSRNNTILTSDIINSILDWRDNDNDARGGGNESDYYKDKGYSCRNGKFKALDELMLVKGIEGTDSRTKLDALRQYLTIYGNNDGKINVNTAGEEILAAIIMFVLPNPGEALSRVSDIIEARGGIVFKDINNDVINQFFATFDDNQKKSIEDWLTVTSNFFQANVEAEIRKNMKKKATAIFDRSQQIYYWHEE